MRWLPVLLIFIVLDVLPNLSSSAAMTQAKGDPVQKADWQPAILPLAKQNDIKSSATGKTYRIQIGKIGPRPESGYPVVYVLDGDAMFPIAYLYAMARAMQLQDHTPVSVLIVGVGYSNSRLLDMNARAADYTPPSPDYEKTGDAFAKKFGEADRFLSFLDQELKPMITREFSIDKNQQTLIGHSYGGLFTLYALYTQPESFRNYIVSSPSIWWNKGIIRTYFEQFKKKQRNLTSPLSVRITSGSLEEIPSTTAQGNDQRIKMLNSRKMVSNAQDTAKAIEGLGNPDIKVEYVLYPQQTHGTVAFSAVADGMVHAIAATLASP